MKNQRNKNKWISAIAVCIGAAVAIVLAVWIALTIKGATAQEIPWKYKDVVAVKGDTLWGFAEDYAPRGYSKKAYVNILKDINGIPDGRIYPGDVITIMYLD